MALCRVPIARSTHHQASCKRITPASPTGSRQIGHGSFFCTSSRAQRVQHTRVIPPLRRTEHAFSTPQGLTIAWRTCRSWNKLPVTKDEFIFEFFQKGGFNMATIDECGPHRQIVAHLAFAYVQNVHVARLDAVHQHFRSAPGPAPELMAEWTYHNVTMSWGSKAG